MKKTLILLGMLLISFTLVACGDEVADVTAPTFTSIMVDGMSPVAEGELVTYYKGKNEVILIEVNIVNPDNAIISYISIDGYKYYASRFTEESTSSTIYFEMSAGVILGNKVLSLDEIVYKNGDISEKVTVGSNNEFRRYVFKTMPTVVRDTLLTDSSSIAVNFEVADIDGVIAENSLVAQLYSGETLVDYQILDPTDASVLFVSLLSNKNYRIEVKANYDLDNSEGPQTEDVLFSGPFSTLNNSIPNASILNPNVTSNSITLDVVYNDIDGVTIVGGLSIGVYLDDVLVDEIDLAGGSITATVDNLLNDNEYVLKVLSDYDLLDGHLTITDAVLATYTFSTLPRDIPEAVITNLTIEENRVFFNYKITDPGDIIDEDTIEMFLYIDGVFKESIPLNKYMAEFQVNNLFANTSFLIQMKASVDLNNGAGIVPNTVIYTLEDSTNENAVPLVIVDELYVTQGYVTVELEVIDLDETINGALTAILYEVFMVGDIEAETEVSRIQFDTEDKKIVFAYLNSYLKGYRVDIIADYDLIDGTAPKVNRNLFKSITITSERKPPAVELNDAILTTESISLNVNLMDSDETIIANSMIIYLLLEGVLVPGSQNSLVVGNNPIEFTGLLSNNEYEIVVEVDYTYDLAESSVDLFGQVLINETVFTTEKEAPTASISEVFSEVDSITFKVNVLDTFDTIDELTLVAELYLNDVYTGKFETLTVGNNFAIEFDGLLSDKQYEIRIKTNFDLNDGNDYLDISVLTDHLQYTEQKEVPSIENFILTSTQDEIFVDVDIIDIHGVVVLPNLTARLYLGNVYTGFSEDIDLGINSGVTFDDIYANERYSVRIFANFDFNDELPIQTEVLMGSSYINTLTNAMMTAEIDLDSVVVDKNSIMFDVEVIDINTVLIGNLTAVLYDEFGVAVPGKIETLVVGENDGVTFSGLQSEANYEVRILADYDMDEELGAEVYGGLLDSTESTTLSLTAPSASIAIDPDEVLNTRIEFDVFVTDNDLTITDLLTLKAVLYDMAGVQVGLPIDLAVGANTDKFFDGLEFGVDYEIIIVTDFDLNNGGAVLVGEELVSQFETTIPIISIDSVGEDKRYISLNLAIDDVFGVLIPIGDITIVEVRLFDETDTQVGDVFFVEEPTSFDLVNLWSDYDYYIEVTAIYDVGYGTILTPEVVFTYNLTTLALETPVASIYLDHEVLELATDITFDIDGLTDSDAVIVGFEDGVAAGTLEAVLFIDGLETDAQAIIGNGTYTFTGYDGTDGRDYSIVLRGDFDRNEAPLTAEDLEVSITAKSWIYADKN